MPGVPWVINRAELAFPLNLFGNANITHEAVSGTRLIVDSLQGSLPERWKSITQRGEACVNLVQAAQNLCSLAQNWGSPA
jgi:hypothetical protein